MEQWPSNNLIKETAATRLTPPQLNLQPYLGSSVTCPFQTSQRRMIVQAFARHTILGVVFTRCITNCRSTTALSGTLAPAAVPRREFRAGTRGSGGTLGACLEIADGRGRGQKFSQEFARFPHKFVACFRECRPLDISIVPTRDDADRFEVSFP